MIAALTRSSTIGSGYPCENYNSASILCSSARSGCGLNIYADAALTNSLGYVALGSTITIDCSALDMFYLRSTDTVATWGSITFLS